MTVIYISFIYVLLPIIRTICNFKGTVNDYNNPSDVRNCYLFGLTDLNGKLEYVRDKVAGYFNHLIEIGVAGIRIDAAKHMWPKVGNK
jgi:alpha-amylase